MYTQANTTGSIHELGIPIQPTQTEDTLTTTGAIATYKSSPQEINREAQNIVYKNLASNGSVVNRHGTFGWIKEILGNEIQEGNREVSRGPGEMNSYQTKAQGAAEVLLWTPPESLLKATLYIYNKGVVQRITQERPIHPLQAEWELLEPTRQYIKTNQITI